MAICRPARCRLASGLLVIALLSRFALGSSPVEAVETPSAVTGTIELGAAADPNQTGFEVPADATAQSLLEELVPSRSDSARDWYAPLEPLYRCGEPRILCPLIPPPPCHPTQPPAAYDLVGVPGSPSSGPLYEGPCKPRAGSRDHCRWPTLRRAHDAFVDRFYSPNYWPK